MNLNIILMQLNIYLLIHKTSCSLRHIMRRL